MHGRGAAVGCRAELLAEPAGQVVVRRQGSARPGVRHQRAHQVADRLLVQGVGLRCLRGDGDRAAGVERGQRLGEHVARLPAQGVGLAADGLDPVGVAFVGQRGRGAEQVER